MSFYHSLIGLGLSICAATRADRLLGSRARGHGMILTLHHVRPEPEGLAPDFAPNRLLSVTPAFLDTALTVLREAGYRFVALGEVPDLLAGDRPDMPFVAVTFDDGYRDNRDHALPVLARHGVPWTLFVTPGFLDRTARLWWLEMEAAFRALDRVRLDLQGVPFDMPTATQAQKKEAHARLYWALRALPEPALLEAVGRLAGQAGIDGRRFVDELCLDWDELGALADTPGLTIGAHTLSHPRLATLPSAEAAREIGESRDMIARRLGRAVDFIAYPVGDPASAGDREAQLAQEAGFAGAVTTRPGHLHAIHATQRYLWPRVSLNGLYQTSDAVRVLASGVPFAALDLAKRAKGLLRR
jgi:peptidoglycan/xylan/chitin deacetylase (PgdA/CDA1 family)